MHMRNSHCLTFLRGAVFGLLLMSFNVQADQLILKDVVSRLPPQVIASAHEYALDIINSCPPRRCMVLSLGLTNTLVDAFLRNEMKSRKIEDNYIRYWPYIRLMRMESWSSEDRFKWFAENFPSRQESAGKAIVIERTLIMGGTMRWFLPALRAYLEHGRYTCKIEPYVIVSPELNFDFDILQPYLGTVRKVVNEQYVETFGWRRSFEQFKLKGQGNPIEQYYSLTPTEIPEYHPEYMNPPKINKQSLELDAWVANWSKQRTSVGRILKKCRNLLTAAKLKSRSRSAVP